MKTIKRLLKNEDGAAAVEYALIASLIGLAIVGSVGILGTSIRDTLTNVAGAL